MTTSRPNPQRRPISVLLPREAKTLKVRVRWGDYRRQGDDRAETWRRTAIEEEVEITAPQRLDRPHEYKVPRSDGLRIALMVQPVGQFIAPRNEEHTSEL